MNQRLRTLISWSVSSLHKKKESKNKETEREGSSVTRILDFWLQFKRKNDKKEEEESLFTVSDARGTPGILVSQNKMLWVLCPIPSQQKEIQNHISVGVISVLHFHGRPPLKQVILLVSKNTKNFHCKDMKWKNCECEDDRWPCFLRHLKHHLFISHQKKQWKIETSTANETVKGFKRWSKHCYTTSQTWLTFIKESRLYLIKLHAWQTTKRKHETNRYQNSSRESCNDDGSREIRRQMTHPLQ